MRVCSLLGLVPKDEAAVNSLLIQHPPAPSDIVLPVPPNHDYTGPTVTTEDDMRRIEPFFSPGSAGGWMICVSDTLGPCRGASRERQGHGGSRSSLNSPIWC